MLRALLLLVCNLALCYAAETTDAKPIDVEHSLATNADGKREFSSRGSLFFSDPRRMVQDGTKKSPLHTSKAKLSGVELAKFRKLVDEDGNYLVRIKNPSGSVVTAYARACALVASGFREEWAVTMDQSGDVIALNYQPKVNDCDGGTTQLEDPVQFETSVRMAYPWRGIRPDVKAGIASTPGQTPQQQQQQQQQSQQKAGSDKDGAPEEEKTFLQKYWLYLAIPGVFMMMNGLPPEEGQGGGRPGARPPPRARPAK